MIVVIDAHYNDAVSMVGVGAVVIDQWASEYSSFTFSDQQTEYKEYTPGKFYLRELPCILPIIETILNQLAVSTIVVDGYVDLSPGRAGLGRHLHNAIDQQVEVVGVAKNEFTGTHATRVLRGKSKHPLWVTSTSNQFDATQCIQAMAGESRLPEMVKVADKLARDASGMG